jgi:hypothetical protein
MERPLEFSARSNALKLLIAMASLVVLNHQMALLGVSARLKPQRQRRNELRGFCFIGVRLGCEPRSFPDGQEGHAVLRSSASINGSIAAAIPPAGIAHYDVLTEA